LWQIAPGVHLLEIWPPNRLNVYLVGDVLVDTGSRWDFHRLLRQMEGRQPKQIFLTHAHPDHQGNAERLSRLWGVPVGCHHADADALEGKTPLPPSHPIGRAFVVPVFGGPAVTPVERLDDGDMVADFRVVHAPGHSPGHSLLYRESDGVAIAGDLLANINFLTCKSGLREPPRPFSTNWRENRESIRKLFALKPSVVCFGHGPPLLDKGLLKRIVDRMKR